MSTWEVIVTVVGTTGLTGLATALGYALSKQNNHDVRIKVLEARMDAEFSHLNSNIREIKDGMQAMTSQIVSLRETIARNNL